MLRNLIKKIFNIKISPELSKSYLFRLCIAYTIDMLRGFFTFGKLKIFVGKKAKFINKQKIKFPKNGYVKLSQNVFIDATSSKDGFGVVFGNHCSVGKNTRIECSGSLSFLGKGLKCGNDCGLGTDSFYGCAGGIEIGDDVIVGNYVSMHSENHNYNDSEIPIRLQGVNHQGIKIGNNCWIGAKATILDGAIIGNGCIVAAGAVVTGQFPDNVIIGGVPSRIIKERIEK